MKVNADVPMEWVIILCVEGFNGMQLYRGNIWMGHKFSSSFIKVSVNTVFKYNKMCHGCIIRKWEIYEWVMILP